MSAQRNPEREALAVLAERGWCQWPRTEQQRGGQSYSGACIGIALGMVSANGDLLRCVIGEQYPERCGKCRHTIHQCIPCFNDHPETTLEDVILVLSKAAIRRDEMIT